MRQLARIRAGAAARVVARAEPAHRVSLRFGERRVDLHADAAAAARYAERVYAWFRGEPDGAADLQILVLERGSAAHAAACEQLKYPRPLPGDVVVASWFGFAVVVATPTIANYYASKLLRLAVVEAWAGEAATLHAASVAGARGGALLVGEPAAGKTSLTLGLVGRGLRFGADDTTPLRMRDLRCLPFPTPFMVRGDERTGAAPPLRELAGRPPDVGIVGEGRWLVDRSDAVAQPFRPTHLFFLDPSATSREVSRPIPASDALFELLRNTVLPLGADPATTDRLMGEYLDGYAALVSDADTRRLDTGDLARARDHLEELLA